MHYLITGATGFIGSHLARRLVKQGEQVSIFLRFDSDRSRIKDVLEKLGRHEVDLRTASSVSRAIDTIEPTIVFHCAAAGVSDPFLPPDEAIRSNVYGTLNLLRAIKGRARVMVLRTSGEIDALNVYAASKAAAWQFCRMYRRTQGWPIAGAMLYQVYGPHQDRKNVIPAAVEAALADRDFPMTSGRSKRDWIYIDDVIDALIALVKADRFDVDTIEIGTGRSIGVREVVEKVYQLIGRSGKPIVGALPDRPGEVEVQQANSEATASILNWRASTSIDDGLKATIQWMQT
jgi:nucleoside-diphosphate-sugar epimerase